VLARKELGNLKEITCEEGQEERKGGELGKKTMGIVIEPELHKKWTERG